MTRLKKKTSKHKKVVAKPSDRQVLRNRILFGVGVAAAMLLMVGLVYGYSLLAGDWQVTKGLDRIASDDEEMRLDGIRRLAKVRAREHLADVGELLLTDPSINVRRGVPDALVRMRDRSAIPWLIFGLGDEADTVANAAMESLQSYLGSDFGWEKVLGWWEENSGEFSQSPEGLPVLDAMAKLLESEEYYVRLAAVHRLARLKHEAVRPLLERAAADDNEKVKEAAAAAMAEL